MRTDVGNKTSGDSLARAALMRRSTSAGVVCTMDVKNRVGVTASLTMNGQSVADRKPAAASTFT